MSSTDIIDEIEHKIDIDQELENPELNHFRSIHSECIHSWSKIFQPGTILESNCSSLYRVKGIVARVHDDANDCNKCFVTSWTKHCPVCTKL